MKSANRLKHHEKKTAENRQKKKNRRVKKKRQQFFSHTRTMKLELFERRQRQQRNQRASFSSTNNYFWSCLAESASLIPTRVDPTWKIIFKRKV